MSKHENMVSDLRGWARYYTTCGARATARFFNEVADEIKRLRAALDAYTEPTGKLDEASLEGYAAGQQSAEDAVAAAYRKGAEDMRTAAAALMETRAKYAKLSQFWEAKREIAIMPLPTQFGTYTRTLSKPPRVKRSPRS